VLDAYAAEHSAEFDLWCGPYMDRLACAHPPVVERYFGTQWAREVAFNTGIQRAAAVSIGVHNYFESVRSALEELPQTAEQVESDAAIARRRSDMHAKVARAYREVGFAGFAAEHDAQAVRALLLGGVIDRAAETAMNHAVAAIELGDFRAAQLHAFDFRFRVDVPAHWRDRLDLATDVAQSLTGWSPDLLSIERARLILESAPTDDAVLTLFGVCAEAAIALEAHEFSAETLIVLERLSEHRRESSGYPRWRALAIDSGASTWTPLDEATPIEGRILDLARQGRRLALCGESNRAIDAYSQAECLALKFRLEGVARACRVAINSIHRWDPSGSTQSGEWMNDEHLLSSYSTDRATYPTPADNLEAATLAALIDPAASVAEAAASVIRSFVGGLITEEFAAHRVLAEALNLAGKPDDAVRHLVMAGVLSRIPAVATHSKACPDLNQWVAAPLHLVAKAACVVYADLGLLLAHDYGQVALKKVLDHGLRASGYPKFLVEYAADAVGTLAVFTSPESFDDVVRFTREASNWLREDNDEALVRTARWLYRLRGDRLADIDELVAHLCASRTGFTAKLMPILEERQLRHGAPPSWMTEAIGAAEASSSAVQASRDLEVLLSRSPRQSSSQGAVHWHWDSAEPMRLWSSVERQRAMAHLWSIAEAPFEPGVNRYFALNRLAFLCSLEARNMSDEARRQHLRRCLMLANEMERPAVTDDWLVNFLEEPVSNFWYHALSAAEPAVSEESLDELRPHLARLLYSSNESHVIEAARIGRRLAHRSMVPFSPSDLMHHPSPHIRGLAAALAIAQEAGGLSIVMTLSDDADVTVRNLIASHVEFMTTVDATAGETLAAKFAVDSHATIRWVAADSLQQCRQHLGFDTDEASSHVR
jgi:hypothetical protein